MLLSKDQNPELLLWSCSVANSLRLWLYSTAPYVQTDLPTAQCVSVACPDVGHNWKMTDSWQIVYSASHASGSVRPH